MTQLFKTTILAALVAIIAGCSCPAPRTEAPAPAPAPVVDDEREHRMEEAYGSK